MKGPYHCWFKPLSDNAGHCRVEPPPGNNIWLVNSRPSHNMAGTRQCRVLASPSNDQQHGIANIFSNLPMICVWYKTPCTSFFLLQSSRDKPAFSPLLQLFFTKTIMEGRFLRRDDLLASSMFYWLDWSWFSFLFFLYFRKQFRRFFHWRRRNFGETITYLSFKVSSYQPIEIVASLHGQILALCNLTDKSTSVRTPI